MKRKAVEDKMRKKKFKGIDFLPCWENCVVLLVWLAVNIPPLEIKKKKEEVKSTNAEQTEKSKDDQHIHRLAALGFSLKVETEARGKAANKLQLEEVKSDFYFFSR